MNAYMNRVALNTFSYFDTGKNPSVEEPERFYHGFVLGLMVDLHFREKSIDWLNGSWKRGDNHDDT